MVGESHEVLLGQDWSGAAIKSGAGDSQASRVQVKWKPWIVDCAGMGPLDEKRVWRNPCLEKKAPVPGGCAALHAFVFDGGWICVRAFLVRLSVDAFFQMHDRPRT